MNFVPSFISQRQPSRDGRSRESLLATLKPYFDGVLNQFYAEAQRDPARATILAKGPGVDALKRAQITHWEALLESGRSDELRERSRRIGEAHVRVGLTPDYYIKSYCFFFKAFTGLLLARAPGKPSY